MQFLSTATEHIKRFLYTYDTWSIVWLLRMLEVVLCSQWHLQPASDSLTSLNAFNELSVAYLKLHPPWP
jgi:hypothetical protein